MLKDRIEQYNETLKEVTTHERDYLIFEAKNKVLNILMPMEYDEVVHETGKLKQQILTILEVNKYIELK